VKDPGRHSATPAHRRRSSPAPAPPKMFAHAPGAAVPSAMAPISLDILFSASSSEEKTAFPPNAQVSCAPLPFQMTVLFVRSSLSRYKRADVPNLGCD
jgi:hypothetical protein